jgi:hypothetical protein
MSTTERKEEGGGSADLTGGEEDRAAVVRFFTARAAGNLRRNVACGDGGLGQRSGSVCLQKYPRVVSEINPHSSTSLLNGNDFFSILTILLIIFYK